jgi:hypothetical protein
MHFIDLICLFLHRYAPYNKPSALLDWVTADGPKDNEIVVMVCVYLVVSE